MALPCARSHGRRRTLAGAARREIDDRTWQVIAELSTNRATKAVVPIHRSAASAALASGRQPAVSVLIDSVAGVRGGAAWPGVVALCLVQFVDVLGVTVVVTALPRMLADLHAPESASSLIANVAV